MLSKHVPDNPAEALANVTSAQLGRGAASLGYALLLTPLLQNVLSLLLPEAWLSWTLSVLLLAGIFVAVTTHLAKPLTWAYPKRAFQVLRGPLELWRLLSYPFWRPVSALSRLLNLPAPQTGSGASLEKLREQLELEQDDRRGGLLKNVLDFATVLADDIMVPRADVSWLSAKDAPEIILNKMQESSHTRFPLCDGTPDEVLGYLHVKDFTFLQTAFLEGRVPLGQLTRPLVFVPQSAKAIELLERFRLERTHMAVVVDEFGGMAGIVTMEDLLEELVGEIQDEFDLEQAGVVDLGSQLLAEGSVRLDDLEKRHGLAFGETNEDTLGGLVFGRLGREARTGDEVGVANLRLRVLRVNGPRVTRVRIVKTSAETEETATPAVLLTSSLFID